MEDKDVEREDRASLLRRLAFLSRDELMLVDYAYDLAKEAHRRQARDSGERYFEHPRSIVIIMVDELGIRDPNMLIAGLLHDTIEDSPMFGNARRSYATWTVTARFRLGRTFSYDVATWVIGVSEPKVSEGEFATKADAHAFHMANMAVAVPEVLLLKMVDRLHNLRTLGSVTPEKRARKLKETREEYLPLFARALGKFPHVGALLLLKIDDAMAALEQG